MSNEERTPETAVEAGGPSEVERIAELWDQTTRQRAISPIQGWLDSTIVLETYVQPKVSGSPRTNWLIGIAERLAIPKTGRWLSLGCGSAGLEIFASINGLFRTLVAFDVSPVSIEAAQKAAAAHGVANIEFRAGLDLNRVDLPRGEYDVVLMNMSLHHVRELESLLDRVGAALKPEGYLLINEFVGAPQFQFSDLQVALVAELLEVLPDRWKKDSATGGVKTEYTRMPVEHWNVADPSEAIRSDRIVPEILERFEVVARHDYGGTILNLLLEHIVHNFDPADEKDVAAIRLLAKCEDLLIRHGVIPSDFTVMAMKRRPPAPRSGLFSGRTRTG